VDSKSIQRNKPRTSSSAAIYIGIGILIIGGGLAYLMLGSGRTQADAPLTPEAKPTRAACN